VSAPTASPGGDTTADGRLDDRVIVVTGAGQGLGEAVCEVVGALGGRVVALDLDGERAAAVAERLGERGVDAFPVTADVSDEASVRAAAAATLERFGTCDGLVNNAGIIGFTPLEDLSVEDWDRVMAVNVRGSFLCAKHFGRLMLDRGRGAIVNIASVAGTAPEPTGGAYGPSKAAAIMLARQIATEWGSRGIRANAVSPGIMRTPMAEGFNSDPEAYRRRLEMVAIHRIGDPHEVARVVAFLLSDAASYLTAQNIEVDGGLMQMMIKALPRPGVPQD
jgi:NAD(P)-dependent dehydrogenase (short-subunit alcohol dehydrogenase family)